MAVEVFGWLGDVLRHAETQVLSENSGGDSVGGHGGIPGPVHAGLLGSAIAPELLTYRAGLLPGCPATRGLGHQNPAKRLGTSWIGMSRSGVCLTSSELRG